MNAAAWDEEQGPTGNNFQRELVFPVAEQLLDIPAHHYERVCICSPTCCACPACCALLFLKELIHWMHRKQPGRLQHRMQTALHHACAHRCWRSAAAMAALRGACRKLARSTTSWRPTLARSSCGAHASGRPRTSTRGCASVRWTPRADPVGAAVIAQQVQSKCTISRRMPQPMLTTWLCLFGFPTLAQP